MQLITVQKCTKINVIPHDTLLCEIGHKASVLFYTFLGAMQVGTYFPIKRTHINVIQEVLPEGGSCILLYGKFYRKAFPVDSYMGSWYGKPVPAWSVRKQTPIYTQTGSPKRFLTGSHNLYGLIRDVKLH